jgi:hypothetical protein
MYTYLRTEGLYFIAILLNGNLHPRCYVTYLFLGVWRLGLLVEYESGMSCCGYVGRIGELLEYLHRRPQFCSRLDRFESASRLSLKIGARLPHRRLQNAGFKILQNI